jgi:CubicO group peptidase (beta-lactamase class C family)
MHTERGVNDAAYAREMTVQDLMRHTAGLTYGQRGARDLHPDYPPSSDWVAERWSPAEFLQHIAALPLHYAPGTRWDYSFGFDLLGLIIERITGMSLGRYLAERLFDPLGMRDTAFLIPEGKTSRYAKALGADPLTKQPQKIRDGTQRKKFDCGGGGAVSTAADYLRFAQMLCNGGALDGTRILGRKTVDYMTSDHIGPEVDTTRLNQYPNISGYGFGLGVAVRRLTGVAGVMSSIGEFHWAGSTGTYFWVDPAESLVVVFMAHTPGAIRYYYRQMLHALVLQALV